MHGTECLGIMEISNRKESPLVIALGSCDIHGSWASIHGTLKTVPICNEALASIEQVTFESSPGKVVCMCCLRCS